MTVPSVSKPPRDLSHQHNWPRCITAQSLGDGKLFQIRVTYLVDKSFVEVHGEHGELPVRLRGGQDEAPLRTLGVGD